LGLGKKVLTTDPEKGGESKNVIKKKEKEKTSKKGEPPRELKRGAAKGRGWCYLREKPQERGLYVGPFRPQEEEISRKKYSDKEREKNQGQKGEQS